MPHFNRIPKTIIAQNAYTIFYLFLSGIIMQSTKLLTSAALVFTLVLGACSTTPSATPTPYKAAKSKESYGYSSVQLSDNEYRVLFKATDRTPADIIQQYSLQRAAEIAKQNNYSWLTIIKTDVEKKPTIARTITPAKKPEPFSSDKQCTMSGCNEIAEPMSKPKPKNIKQTQINDVYVSILVKMGNSQESLGKHAMSVNKILAGDIDEAK